jgi:L-amino acid N-acyltransferase YncA
MGFRHYRETGVDKIKVLIGADNTAGNKLYLKSGFEHVGQIINHGLPSNVYVAQINQV